MVQRGNECGVCAGLERLAVASERGVALVDHLLGRHCGRIKADIGLSIVEGLDGFSHVVWG